MTDHEHEWEYVQKQILFEGFEINNMEEEEGVVFVIVDSSKDPKWQDVAELADEKISCMHCHIELIPEGGWQVEWQNISR